MIDQARESYIESELKKWKENYVIPFEQEFQLNAMLTLQYQFLKTPDDHVKTKRDLIDAINRISGSLRLEKYAVTEKPVKVLVVAKRGQTEILFQLFREMLLAEITTAHSALRGAGIKTSRFHIEITEAMSVSETLRGKRADYILNLTGNSEIDDYFKGINKL